MELTNQQKEQIQSACDYMDKYKLVLKTLLWSTTLAILLLGLAGGLAELSNVPVCI